tara:strand:+ start:3186 stop:4331 length:1146 start_codon:yes stop_codon:yes gene_type:complete
MKNILKSFQNILSHKKVKQPLKKINLLFQACNLKCPMCSMNVNNTEVPQILRDYPNASISKNLSLKEYKSIFVDIYNEYKNDLPSISISGGEPTYFPKLIELLFFLKDLGFTVGLTTNGTLLNKQQLEKLASLNLGITISLDGRKKVNDMIRGRGSYDKAVESIKFLLKVRNTKKDYPIVSSLFCIHSENYSEMRNVVKYNIEELKIDSQTMSYFIFSNTKTLQLHENWRIKNKLDEKYRIKSQHGGNESNNNFASFPFEEVYSTQMELKKIYGNKIIFEPYFSNKADMFNYFTSHKINKKYFYTNGCGPAEVSLSLISNGDVLFFPQCFEIKLGNVRDNKLSEIYDGRLMNEIRQNLKKNLSPICSHCCANRREKIVPLL